MAAAAVMAPKAKPRSAARAQLQRSRAYCGGNVAMGEYSMLNVNGQDQRWASQASPSAEKVERPDHEAHEAMINVKCEEISDLELQLEEICKQINEQAVSKEQFIAQKNAISKQLDANKGRLDELARERRLHQDRGNSLEAEATDSEDGCTDRWSRQLALLDADIAAAKAERSSSVAALKDLVNARKAQVENISELMKEQKLLEEQIRAKTDDRDALQSDFRLKSQAYEVHTRVMKQMRREKFRDERRRRDAEWEAWRREKEKEKEDQEPHVAERTLVEQTIQFCKSMMPKAAEEDDMADAAAKPLVPKDHESSGFEGLVVLTKKKERDEFQATSKKRGKRAGKKEDTSTQAIRHNLETLALFSKLSVAPPMTVDELPGALEKLELLMQGYRAKVEAWQIAREEKRKARDSGAWPQHDKDADAVRTLGSDPVPQEEDNGQQPPWVQDTQTNDGTATPAAVEES